MNDTRTARIADEIAWNDDMAILDAIHSGTAAHMFCRPARAPLRADNDLILAFHYFLDQSLGHDVHFAVFDARGHSPSPDSRQARRSQAASTALSSMPARIRPLSFKLEFHCALKSFTSS